MEEGFGDDTLDAVDMESWEADDAEGDARSVGYGDCDDFADCADDEMPDDEMPDDEMPDDATYDTTDDAEDSADECDLAGIKGTGWCARRC